MPLLPRAVMEKGLLQEESSSCGSPFFSSLTKLGFPGKSESRHPVLGKAVFLLLSIKRTEKNIVFLYFHIEIFILFRYNQLEKFIFQVTVYV